MNLLDQANILKNLDDNTLQRELQMPSGAVPPYLVLNEINRRKDMRQRYMGQQAMHAPQTTVAQDVAAALPASAATSGVPAAALSAMGGSGAPAGIDAAAGMPPAPTGLQLPGVRSSFASGGVVDAAVSPLTSSAPMPDNSQVPSYSNIAQDYESSLSSIDAARKREAALALIAAGAGMMSGGSSNTLQNIGSGVTAGLNAFANLQNNDLSAKNQALTGLTNIATDQQNVIPQTVREYQYIQSLPPDQQAQARTFMQPFALQNANMQIQDAQTLAQMYHDGDALPPATLGMNGQGIKVQAAFGKMFPGESLSQLQLDAKGAEAWAMHMNSQQMIKQQSNLSAANDQLTKLQALADQWKAGNFPVLNSIQFKAALQGGLGPQAQSLASQFQQQLADTKLTMQQVFAGGYAGTDKQLSQIDNMFSTAAPSQTFDDLINLARTNVGYRYKALSSPEAFGAAGYGSNAFTGGGNQGASPAATPATSGTTSTNIPFTVEP